MEIRFKPIGVVHTKAGDDDVKEKGDQEGDLEIFPEFAAGLEGIDGYSHLFVVVYFDRLRPEQIGPLKVKPRALLRRGFKLDDLPELGVFALDSPTRPNPIGLTLVRVLRREGCRIMVRGWISSRARRFSTSRPIAANIAPTSSRCPNGFASWPVQKVMSEPNSEGSHSHCNAVLRKLRM
jgi:tRNA (adenine37-N6)-methyltransferase